MNLYFIYLTPYTIKKLNKNKTNKNKIKERKIKYQIIKSFKTL